MSLLPNYLSQFSASRQRKLWSTFIFGAMLLRMSRTHSLQPFFSAQSPSVKCVYSWTKIDTFVADDGISADKGSLRIEQKLGEDFCSLSFRITSEDLRASETVGVPPHFSRSPSPSPSPLFIARSFRQMGATPYKENPFAPILSLVLARFWNKTSKKNTRKEF